jgi:hypothetical protein
MDVRTWSMLLLPVAAAGTTGSSLHTLATAALCVCTVALQMCWLLQDMHYQVLEVHSSRVHGSRL